MNILEMTSRKLVKANVSLTSREEILNYMCELLYDEGYLEDLDSFKKEVYKREEISNTGLENGLAIPHGKSSVVKKACFAVITLEKKLNKNEWPSIDSTNCVDTIFLLAIPEVESGNTHLKLLSELSVKLMNNNFLNDLKKSKDSNELYSVLENYNTIGEQKKVENNKDDYIVAVTSCSTGIAHTYMAAEALEKGARDLGIGIYVEKQGANGPEDKLTADQISKAKGVIFAVDTKVIDRDRFVGKPYVEVKVAEPLKNSINIINDVLKSNNKVTSEEFSNMENIGNKSKKSGKTIKDEILSAVMTGISYMIPLLVGAGLMLGIAKLAWILLLGLDPNVIGDVKYNDAGGWIQFFHYMDDFGNMLFKFIYPVFAMFAAYSIADRTGLVAGFVGGIFAAGLHYTFWGVDNGVPSGFLGALVLGLVAGYISRFLNKSIKLNKNLSAMKPMFLIPGLSVLIIFVLNLFIVDPVFGGLNKLITDIITEMSNSGKLGLSAVIATATAFDLGGPVNKAAGAIAIGLATDKIFPLTARVLSIVIPPIGLGLSTMIDKYIVGRHVYPDDLRVAGGTSFLLGFLAISEGAIPFMLRNPLITIPINIFGAILGSCVAVYLGAVQWLPLPAVWGWPLVENLPAYLIGLIVGVLFIAIVNILVRNYMLKKNSN